VPIRSSASGIGTSRAAPVRGTARGKSPEPPQRNIVNAKRSSGGTGAGVVAGKTETGTKGHSPSNRKSEIRKEKIVKFRALARSVFALMSLNRELWQKRKTDHLEALKNYRTEEGKFRIIKLPWCPLTNHADQVARDEMVEVVQGLYQSNWRGAEDEQKIKSRGITHVLSTLEEEENPFPTVFQYLNLVFDDDEAEDPSKHFHTAASFIRDAIEAGGCLVHCAAGVSRSSSLTLAYLIRERRMTLKEALQALRERRPICWPNAGFMAKLIKFETSIYAGRASIQPEEYLRWTDENYEAVQMAKLVDRDRSMSMRALSAASAMSASEKANGQSGGRDEVETPPVEKEETAMKGRTPIVEEEDEHGLSMSGPPSRARA